MRLEKVLLIFLVIINSATCAQEQVDLGPNLLINNDFSTPNIKAMGYDALLFIPYAILGWNCTVNCQVINCKGFNKQVYNWNPNLFGGDCPQQAIDTSSGTIEVISQNFQAKAGDHILDIKFLCPILLARQKILVFMINQQIVNKFYPLYQDFNDIEVSMSIILREGNNKISLTSEGIKDAFGFRVFDVKITILLNIVYIIFI